MNPNVAMLTGFMCHEDNNTAIRRGLEGAHFFAFGLGHYWRDGTHIPGQTSLWNDFENKPASYIQRMELERKKAGMGGIGSPKHVIENFRALENAGVDQLIFLQQSGRYQHEHICKSLELFGSEILPQFKEREIQHEKLKQDELLPFMAEARNNIEPLYQVKEVPPVEAYPLMWQKVSMDNVQPVPDRRPGMTSFWQMQVGGKRSKPPHSNKTGENAD